MEIARRAKGSLWAVPPIGFRSDSAARAAVPPDWTVWAFSDAHGMDSSFGAALGAAGLADARGHWSGGPKIALVGVGDYIDRGPSSAPLVARLVRLATEMAAAGSRLVLVRGNHEQMLADIMRGSGEWLGAWKANGGDATARSFGLPGMPGKLADVGREMAEAEPGLLAWLLGLLPYARWRDVMFVHAGLVPGLAPADLANDDGQMWDEAKMFLASKGLAGEHAFARYRDAGVRRVVVGHRPQAGAIGSLHEGTTIIIDTNAAGVLYTRRREQLPGAMTLVRLDPDPPFGDVHRVSVPTAG